MGMPFPFFSRKRKEDKEKTGRFPLVFPVKTKKTGCFLPHARKSSAQFLFLTEKFEFRESKEGISP